MQLPLPNILFPISDTAVDSSITLLLAFNPSPDIFSKRLYADRPPDAYCAGPAHEALRRSRTSSAEKLRVAWKQCGGDGAGSG